MEGFNFLHLLLQARLLCKGLIKLPYKASAFIKEPLQSVEVVKPSISRGLEGFTFSTLASTGSYKGFFVKVL